MASSLRVLLVTPDYPPPPGGIQTVTRNIERGLEEAGHAVELLHVDPSAPERTPTDLLPRPRWCYSASATATGQFVYLNAVYRRAKSAIESFDPDVVHALHVRNWPALAAAREQGIPSVVSTHALELGERALASNAIANVDGVHAVSEFTESLVENVARDTPPTRVIPPSIDVAAFRSRDNRNGPGPVVTMARFADRKNIETVVEAWARLDDQTKAGRELVVIGDGPNRDRIANAARGRSDVQLQGWVDEAEKRRLLAEADLFVLVPSRIGFDVEGFGIVYVEAQAAGTPVVGSSHGGAPEAIGDAGRLVDDERNPDAVADEMERLLTDRDLWNDCVGAAAARIDQFDVPAVTERHVANYRDIGAR